MTHLLTQRPTIQILLLTIQITTQTIIQQMEITAQTILITQIIIQTEIPTTKQTQLTIITHQ